jgi:uncharacterized protein (DUF1697 family)
MRPAAPGKTTRGHLRKIELRLYGHRLYQETNIMAPAHYLALLRGINVGGKNIIKMADLKDCFEGMNLTDVATYIQSGNVVFRSPARDKRRLAEQIEKRLSERFNYSSLVVVVPHRELLDIVESAPTGFGSEPDKYRYDVVFLKEPLTPAEVMEQVSLKEGVDQAYAGKLAFYFSRLTSRAVQSRLNRIASLPIYKYMTIRNWNTTTKLLALMDRA